MKEGEQNMKNAEIAAMLDTERWRIEMTYESLTSGPMTISTKCADYQIREVLLAVDPEDSGPGWDLLKEIRITLA
jgi:hypothetical protein